MSLDKALSMKKAESDLLKENKLLRENNSKLSLELEHLKDEFEVFKSEATVSHQGKGARYLFNFNWNQRCFGTRSN